jgi:hypothetical protein
MARVEQTICDGCGKVLYGKDRKAFQSEDYIQIQGRVSLQLVNKELAKAGKDNDPFYEYKPRYYIFITPRPDSELSLCNVQCFQDYIEQRKHSYEQMRENQLRDETNN